MRSILTGGLLDPDLGGDKLRNKNKNCRYICIPVPVPDTVKVKRKMQLIF